MWAFYTNNTNFVYLEKKIYRVVWLPSHVKYICKSSKKVRLKTDISFECHKYVSFYLNWCLISVAKNQLIRIVVRSRLPRNSGLTTKYDDRN